MRQLAKAVLSLVQKAHVVHVPSQVATSMYCSPPMPRVLLFPQASTCMRVANCVYLVFLCAANGWDFIVARHPEHVSVALP